MKRLMSIALGLALCAVTVPAQAGGGRASAQTFRAAAGGCQSASAQAGGYCPAASAQSAIGYGYQSQVIQQVVPVTTYQRVQRVVTVPVQEQAIMTYDVPVVQQEVVVPSYTVQSQAAVGYGASASAVVQQAAVAPVVVQRAPRRGFLFGRGRRTVSKSKSVVRN